MILLSSLEIGEAIDFSLSNQIFHLRVIVKRVLADYLIAFK
jgi:hypothetical protein